MVELASDMCDPGAKSGIGFSLSLCSTFYPAVFIVREIFHCEGKVATPQFQTSTLLPTSAKPEGSFSQQFQQNPKTDMYFFIGSHAHPWVNYYGQQNAVLPPSEDTPAEIT